MFLNINIIIFEYKNKGDKDKILSVKEYLDMARSYLSDIKNDYKS